MPSGLPGVGIFGSDPISKVLIKFLRHFDFEIHAIWTNNIDSTITNDYKSHLEEEKIDVSKLTNSIDSVLLNKNVNLIFVCCQPNLHAQISTKALGIGKNVICLFPTSKNTEEIMHMINSARYYPSLISSICYGGFKYLSEFDLIKYYIKLIGDVKVCNINIECQNIAQNIKNVNNESDNSRLNVSASALNWLIDRDLGAGVLNRFGAAIISLVINLFDNKKVTKVFGNLKTFIEDIDDTGVTSHTTNTTNNNYSTRSTSKIRKITADDYCTFQLNLEPCSLMVNVTINSLAQCKYQQVIEFNGTNGVLLWKNSNVYLRTKNESLIKNVIQKKQEKIKNLDKINNNNSDHQNDKEVDHNIDFNIMNSYEIELTDSLLFLNEPEQKAETYLNDNFKSIESSHPEMPFLYVRGLYYYLDNVKNEFLNREKQLNNNAFNGNMSNQHVNTNSDLNMAIKSNNSKNLENFEHSHIVQLIIKKINMSSNSNRWITVNYY